MRALTLALPLLAMAQKAPPYEPDWQYRFQEIAIGKAWAGEPRAEAFSLAKALDHLENGALVWVRQAQCVSCHTSGTYLVVRSQLPRKFGPPSPEIRDFFVKTLDVYDAKPPEWYKGAHLEEVIYTAAGLAEYDAATSGKLSPEASRAIRKMFSVQLPSGTWDHASCWPPLESSAYHAATIAARAVTAVKTRFDGDVRRGIVRLRDYLRGGNRKNDYDSVSLLWSAARWPGLIETEERDKIVAMIRARRNSDGGWSLRAFAKPEEWGDGSRAARLRAESETESTASDGHMTGLALLSMLDSGVPPSDPVIRAGIAWLEANQRASGRWWTKSLNTGKWNFITYSGSAYSALAIAKVREQGSDTERSR